MKLTVFLDGTIERVFWGVLFVQGTEHALQFMCDGFRISLPTVGRSFLLEAI